MANIVNPGSVYQTYNPNTGQTTYSAPPTGLYSGTGVPVATPNLPAGTGTPMVAQADATFAPISAQTAYSQPDLAKPATPGITPESLKQVTSLVIPSTPTQKTPDFTAQAFKSEAPTITSTTKTTTPTLPSNLSTTPLGLSGVNSLFKQYYGRNATKEELNYWSNKSDAQLRPKLLPNSAVQLAKISTNLTGNINPVIDTTSKADITIKSIDDYIKEITPSETAEGKKASDLSTMLQSLIPQVAGKSKMLTDEMAKQGGANEIKKELSNAKNTLKSLIAEREALKADQQGKPVTMNSIIGAQAQINAVYDSKILTQTAYVNALIENYDLAKEDAQNAVDSKYGPILESIAIAQSQLEALKPTLDKQDKIRADALTQMYNDQKQKIADKKTDESNIKSVWLKAIELGITDKNVLNNISNAKTFEDATYILGQNASLGTKGDISATTKANLIATLVAGGLSLDAATKQANSIISLSGGKTDTSNTGPTTPSEQETGNRGIDNNNPGNLKGDYGYGVDEAGFAKFPTKQAGLDAMIADLNSKKSGNTKTGLNGNSTLSELIDTWNSGKDGFLGGKGYVEAWTKSGYKLTDKLKDINMSVLAPYISLAEGTSTPSNIPESKYSSIVINAGKSNAPLSEIDSKIRENVRQYRAENGISEPVKLSAVAQNKINEAKSNFGSANALLTTIENRAKKVFDSNVPFGNSYKYLGAIAKTNTEAALYNDSVDSLISILSRSLGEKGVLTDYDIARVRKSLPSFTDTKKIADEKIKQLRNVFNEIKNSSLNAYSQKIASEEGASNQPSGSSTGFTGDLSQFEKP